MHSSTSRGWNKTPSDVHSCLYHALRKYEKMIGSRADTTAFCFNFLTKLQHVKAVSYQKYFKVPLCFRGVFFTGTA